MIAVVDRHAETGIEIRPAAPARLPGQLRNFDAHAFAGQRHGRRQTGEARADHIGRHRESPCRSTIMRSSLLPIFARVRGGAQPCFSILERVAE